MNKPQKYKGKVGEHILINDKFRFLHIELMEPYLIDFQAGQYVSIDVGEGERRAYSIASEPAMNHAIELCVDVSPGGKGSVYVENLKPGDEVNFLGPLGRFVVDSSQGNPFDYAQGKEKKLMFVGTGSGIAPLRSMILDLLRGKKDKREIWLHWGLRFVTDMFWEEDFRRLDKFYDNFNFHLELSKPPELWPLGDGYVIDEIKNKFELGSDWGVYLCGNPQMIKDMIVLMEKKGVPKTQVHFEKYY